MWAFGREGEVVQALLPEFERTHPGIRVRVQQIPFTAAHEKLLTAVVGDATPDLAQLGNTWVPELQALDAIIPLDTLVARSATVRADDYFPGIWDTNVLDNTLYGLPWYVDTRLLFYRTDLLAAAGYHAPPRTWAEWRAMMERIRSETSGRRYGVLLPINEWAPPLALAASAGAPLLSGRGQHADFTEPRFRSAFAFYTGLFAARLAPPVSNVQIANRYQSFANGEFVFALSGPWDVGEYDRRLPDSLRGRWTTAPLPAPAASDGYPGASLAGGSSLVIFRRSPYQAAAWTLIEYLSDPVRQIEFYRLTGDLPARRAAWRDTSLANNPRAQAFWLQLHHVRATPKVPEWEQISMKVADYAESAVRGAMSPDSALVALDRDVDRILEKRRWLLARGLVRAN